MQLNLNENNPFEKARNAFKKETLKPQTFEEHKANFEKSSLGRTVQKAFQDVPYEVENRGIYIVSGAVSYACQLVSVTAAASYVFAFVLSRISTLPYAWYVSLGIAAATLFCIEYLLRKETPKLSRTILLNGFSLNLWRRGLFVLVLTAAGIVSSYLGGFDTAAAVADSPPQYAAPSVLAPTLQDAAQIEKRYSAQIKDAKAAAADYKTRRLWKGRLSISDGNKYRKLLAVATEKEKEMNEEIKAAAAMNTKERDKMLNENKARETAAKAGHGEEVAAYNERIDTNGGGLAGLSVVAQFIFFCCLFYRSHYLIETAKQYASPTKQTSGPAHDPSGNGGGSKKKTLDNLTNEDIETLLHKAQKGANDRFLNSANDSDNIRQMYTANDSAISPQIESANSLAKDFQVLRNDTTSRPQKGKTQIVYKDIEVEHIDKKSGKRTMKNLSEIKKNKRTRKSQLGQAIKANKSKKIIDNLKEQFDYWQGLEEQIYQLSNERQKAV